MKGETIRRVRCHLGGFFGHGKRCENRGVVEPDAALADLLCLVFFIEISIEAFVLFESGSMYTSLERSVSPHSRIVVS